MSLLIEPWQLNTLLILIFFGVALMHSSVGLGGGSSYTAWMVIFALPAPAIPAIALALNVLVSAVCSVQFLRKGLLPARIMLLILGCSIPAAYVGGSLTISSQWIHSILLISLLFVFIRLIFFQIPLENTKITTYRMHHYATVSLLGVVLGLVSGLVGIGGGIYLVPALVILGITSIQQAAACGAVFILCNSSAGLLAKWFTNKLSYTATELLPYLIAVLLGGFIGSQFAVHTRNRRLLEKILATVIFFACALLVQRIFKT